MPKSGTDGLWLGSVGNQCLALELCFRVGPSSSLGLQEGIGTNRETRRSPIPANPSSTAILLAQQVFAFQILLNMSKGEIRQRTMVGMVSVLGCSREGGILSS